MPYQASKGSLNAISKFIMIKIFVFIIILLPIGCFAQFTVSGRILNQADTKPVASASVFINNTTIGTKTGSDGTFILQNLKPGNYILVVSVIGFETYKQPVTINNGDLTLPIIDILSKTIALNEVKIKPNANQEKYFNLYYDTFKDEFLGTSKLAKDCEILNPDVLDLDYDEATNVLTASSSGFLEIENNALGYKIKYLLTNFKLDKSKAEINYEGSVLFTEMKGTPGQERRWQQRRQDVYEGSSMHFLRSVLNNNLDEDGFKALRLPIYANPDRPSDSLIQAKIKQFTFMHYYKKDIKTPGSADSLAFWKKRSGLPKMLQKLEPFPLNKEDIVTRTDQPGVFALGCDNDQVLVMYDKNHHFTGVHQLTNLGNLSYILNKPDNDELTLLRFNEPYTFFDSNGGISNPNSLVLSGAWVRNRVADLLPINYETTPDKNIYTDSLLKSDTVLRNTVGKLNTFSAALPAEKIYLHLDKPNYDFGDTIWYKAYNVTGDHHQLSALSGVLYVEFYNPADSLVVRQTLPLHSGVSWGDIPLPHALKQGNYRIRAYTNWMRNFGTDYFYDQRIQIGGIAPVTAALKPAQANPDVQFFPEGGQLVNGVRSRVAVKSVGVNGLGEDIKGTIEDNEGNAVADFATQHLGMGVFAFIPQSGKTYKARVSGTGETAFTIDLPKALEEGYTLALNNSQPDSIYIKVAVNDQTFNQQKNSIFYIIAQSGGKVYYTTGGKLNGTLYAAKEEKSSFHAGIAKFTVFSQSGEPLAERIAYIEGDDTLKLNITAPAASSITRQNVKLSLQAKDNDNNSIAGSFSVAVINESKTGTDEDAESTILNNLLLTSDLKGHIEKPNYYFINANDQTRANLDILMLTQGYRRFEWKQVLANTKPPIVYQPETSLQLAGTLKTTSGKPVPNGKITLVAAKDNMLRDTTADINGNFKFTELYLTDTTTMMLRARKEDKSSNVTINVQHPAYPALIKTNPADTNNNRLPSGFTEAMQKKYTDYQKDQKQDFVKNGIRLKQVTIKDSRPAAPDLTRSSNLHGGGNADQVIMGDKLGSCVDLSDCLIGKVFGVVFSATGVPKNIRNDLHGSPYMSIIVNGIVQTGDHLNDINVSDIYSIEVLRSATARAVYGTSIDGGGALVITLKDGSERTANSNATPSLGITTFPFIGYSKTRAFYSPKYNAPKNDAQQPDLRTTIYWNPNILTNKDGKATFEYFNADTKGAYRVVVEGIDDNGNLGRQVYRYKVE